MAALLIVRTALPGGALPFHSCGPVSEFGSARPGGVAVPVHAMDADPIVVGDGDIDAARARRWSHRRGAVPLPRRPTLIADSSLSAYDADAAALLSQRVLGFLGAIDERPRML